MALVRRIVANDPEAVDLLDQAVQNPASIHVAVSNRNGTERPAGTTKDAALRRLRKDAPELHAEVLAGAPGEHRAVRMIVTAVLSQSQTPATTSHGSVTSAHVFMALLPVRLRSGR